MAAKKASGTKKFRAVLERLPGNLGWVVARVPFDPAKTWKQMVRLRIVVETGEEQFRTSLFAETGGGGHFVLVNKKMQKAAGVGPGGMIELKVSPDLEAREIETPMELAKILKQEKTLAKWHAGLSDSARHNLVLWITGVKSDAARQKRAEQTAERMMLAMEGEKMLPPILEVAFRRTPVAREGWEKMTLAQRRGHLMGVFYYQSPEAREKRVGKLVEDAVKAAEKD